MSLIYTIVPLEQVYEDKNQQQIDYEEIELDDKTLIIEPTGPYQGKLIRLISNNPDDFLDSRLQPGSIIKYTPSLPE